MRNSQLDTIKGLLIILTVFGHALELTWDISASQLYRIIYSFHMPTFIFISGYFSRWNPKRILTFHFPLYLIFQFSYLLFDLFFIGKTSISATAFFTPYWHLWYLFALMMYGLLIPILSKFKGKKYAFAISISIAASLTFPLIKINLYPFTIGRFFAFLPFFTAGFFCRNLKRKLPNMTFLVPVSLIIIMINKSITLKSLYGSYPYSDPSEIFIRTALILFAFGWISLLFRIPFSEGTLSFIGQNTLPVYLFHGFAIRAIDTFGIRIENDLTALLFSVVLCISLANIPFENSIKAVDSLLKKVYNIINCERRIFSWISKKKSKKSLKKSKTIRILRLSSKMNR